MASPWTASQLNTQKLLASDLSRAHNEEGKTKYNKRCLQDSTEKPVTQATHMHYPYKYLTQCKE